MIVGIGVALVLVFIGQVGVFGVELGVSERGPGQPGSFMEAAIGNGSGTAVEVGVEVAEDDVLGRVGVSEHGPEPCFILEEPSANGSGVAVEEGVGMVEGDDAARVEVEEVSGDEDIERLSV
jgi:hypothetical protein